MEELKFEKENNYLYRSAEKFREENRNTKDLVIAIRKFIRDHARSLPKPYEPKSIIESRFTPVEQAFEKGMMSCGAMANISAYMLRYLGFKVKLIHGECKESVDHAWISVLDPETDSWIEYDITRKDGDVPETHIRKGEVDSWEEIKEQIIEDHSTLMERRKQRGI